MKRQNFTVTSGRGHSEVRHAWNSSVAAVLGVVRQVARDEGCFYGRLKSEYRKDDTGHVWGQQVWTSTKGKSIALTIAKQ